ncbi:DUF6192 family protein [Streptomyces sp. NPDC090045]
MSFTVHRILGAVAEEAERWASLDDPPFNERSGRRQRTPDGAKRLLSSTQ